MSSLKYKGSLENFYFLYKVLLLEKLRAENQKNCNWADIADEKPPARPPVKFRFMFFNFFFSGFRAPYPTDEYCC